MWHPAWRFPPHRAARALSQGRHIWSLPRCGILLVRLARSAAAGDHGVALLNGAQQNVHVHRGPFPEASPWRRAHRRLPKELIAAATLYGKYSQSLRLARKWQRRGDGRPSTLNEGRRPEYFSERWPHLVEDGGKSKKPMLESCSGCGTVVSSSLTHAEAALTDVM